MMISKKMLRVFILALAVISASTGVHYVYASVLVTGNSITVSPVAAPTLAMTASSTSPYVGDTISFVATLSNHQQGVIVTFKFSNGTVLGTSTTSATGVATISYLVPSLTAFTVTPTATV